MKKVDERVKPGMIEIVVDWRNSEIVVRIGMNKEKEILWRRE